MYQNTPVQELSVHDFKKHKITNVIHHRNRKSNKHEGIIKFYTNWCGHCRNFHDSMVNLSKKGIPMKALDCEKNRSLSQKLGVEGYPTLGFVNSNGQIFQYEGTRKESDITTAYKKFLKSNEDNK